MRLKTKTLEIFVFWVCIGTTFADDIVFENSAGNKSQPKRNLGNTGPLELKVVDRREVELDTNFDLSENLCVHLFIAKFRCMLNGKVTVLY